MAGGLCPANVTANLLTGLRIDEYFSRTDSAGPATLLADALGSTLGLTDANGNLNTTYTYEPFGNVAISGAGNANSYQFTGRENDGTGLHYYRARYYHPLIQRFVSQDPIGFAGGINLYSYALNNPISFRDPFGTCSGDPTPDPTPDPTIPPEFPTSLGQCLVAVNVFPDLALSLAALGCATTGPMAPGCLAVAAGVLEGPALAGDIGCFMNFSF